MRSYLSNRLHVVKQENTQSRIITVEYGVPQGSLLAPLYFAIYINIIQELNLHGHIAMVDIRG